VSVVSQNATLPVAFSANDGADNCNSSLAVQANHGTASDQLRMMQVFSDQQSAHHILNFFA
jgi:hypothetical protein